MMKRIIAIALSVVAINLQAETHDAPKLVEREVTEGMTIVGDQELPQVLYLIPWKSPQLGAIAEPVFNDYLYPDITNPCDLPDSYWPDISYDWACEELDTDKSQSTE